MLRGYHPLKEIYRWERVILALWILLPDIVGPGESIEQPVVASQWNTALLLFTPLILIFIWLLLLFPSKRRLTKLFRLQETVLNGQDRPVLFAQPDPALAGAFSLPFSVPTSTPRVFWYLFSIFLLIPVGSILIHQLPLSFPDPYVIPPEVWGMFPLLGIFSVVPGWLAMTMTADFYLLPSLEGDENGIMACYGPDRVRMDWQQIRSIALVEYKRFGSNRIGRRKPVRIYAICDGENTIAWYANPRGKMRQPSSLSLDEYARLLDNQLPALVRLRTGLPLLDLREPKRKKASFLTSGL